jgi:signal peptide peptidase SppA
MNKEIFWALAAHVMANIESGLGVSDHIPAITSESILSFLPTKEIARKVDGIAYIDIKGTMMQNPDVFDRIFYGATDTAEIEAAVRAATTDSEVDQIVLDIDSPGGAVSGTPELGRAVAAAQEVKPVSAYCSGMCASAAYWVASQAGRIVANETSLVGSIGVRMLLHDYSGMYAAAGVKAIPIDTGKFKSAGTPGTEVTPEQIKMYQDIINEHFDRFASAVKTGRGMSDKRFESVKDAQILTAAKGKEAGLIDAVATKEEFLSGIKKKKGRRTASSRARLALYEI